MVGLLGSSLVALDYRAASPVPSASVRGVGFEPWSIPCALSRHD